MSMKFIPSSVSTPGTEASGDSVIARATDGKGGGMASSPARDNSLITNPMRLCPSGDSRNPGKCDGQPILLDAGAGGMTQTPDTAAAPAGDLISRAVACEAAEVYPEDGVIGEQSYWFAMGAMAAREALRALPAAPEAGEVYLIRNERDNLVTNLERAEARLAEVEAERDAALAQVAGAYEAAADHCWNKRDLLADAEKKQISAGLTGRDYYGRRLEAELLSRSIRALTPADTTAAFERAVEARVQAALAAQGEPVAWRYRCAEKLTAWTDPTFNRRSPYARIGMEEQALYAHPAPASAGVTVKPLDLRNAVQAGFDAWAAKPHNKKWARKIDGTPIPNDVVVCIQTAVCATLSQPA